ncbi:unnamed protein product [Hymenolepis diminuta]|uniref:Uridylate-specific endoribonuclease n=1 Tax=Hymenolepis diminuta TaxID=6216 RepID=A0A0R3STU5_HYMDI|nr:unnamed protein product [Hymenolepis diminuta]
MQNSGVHYHQCFAGQFLKLLLLVTDSPIRSLERISDVVAYQSVRYLHIRQLLVEVSMRLNSRRWSLLLVIISALVLCVECRKKHGKYPAFEKLINKLWDLDENRFELGKDIILDEQAHVERQPEDKATRPLFIYVNQSRLYHSPTYKAFIDLMKFYDPDILKVDPSGPEKTQAQVAFLDAIMETKVMEAVQTYLVEKNLVSSDKNVFKELIGNIWFAPYMRKKRLSSSAFEHVFLGEGHGSRAMGLHYWLPLYLHEHDETLNYYVAFMWRGNLMKDFGTFIFGSSPEFEMGVYTAAFLTMNSIWPNGYRFALPIKIKNTKLSVQCYRNDRVLLGSCYLV